MIPINKVYNLIGYWDRDYWDLVNCGLSNIEMIISETSKYRYIDFTRIQNKYIKKELKYYMFNLLLNLQLCREALRDYRLKPLEHLISYFESCNTELISITEIDDDFNKDYIEFLKQHNVRISYECKNRRNKTIAVLLPITIKRFFIDEYNKAFGREVDRWYIEDFNLSSHRINLATRIKTLNFYDVRHQKNKDLFKEYIKHLLTSTQISVTFIASKVVDIKYFLTFIGENDLNKVTRRDIEDYKKLLGQRDINSNTYNRKLFSLSELFNYGIKKKWWSENHIYMEFDIIDVSFSMKGRIVDEVVIEQILNNSNKISFKNFCMFLLLYSCGMRISEVCLLKTNCLKRDEKGCYIVFYQQKMKKEVSNPLPENLYALLEEQSRRVINEFGIEQVYLFPSVNGNQTLCWNYKESMQNVINELGIKNSDGTPYRFRPHEYRHTFATKLIEQDIPLTVVQKLLHHNTPEMSLIYTQVSDTRKKNKYIEFIDIVGNKTQSLFNVDETEAIYEVHWIKNNLKAQALPNGFCSLPVALGICPYANKCLSCNHFKTTKGHLNILQKQLFRTRKIIELIKQNGNIATLEINYEIERNLVKLINSLE